MNTRRKMFLRMITASLLRRRSRMLIALLSIAVGATILAGLVTIYVDVPRQMGAQFRNYGANVLLMPSDGSTMSQIDAEAALENIPADSLVGATPYRYVTLQMASRQLSFTAAGTDFDSVTKTSPYFQIEGAYPAAAREILIGKEVASALGAKTGSVIKLSYIPETTQTGQEDRAAVGGDTLAGSAEGYSENVVGVTVTLADDLSIADMTVNVETQTAGIGQLCGEEAFVGQFIGKTIPVALGEDIDAVTGATITSQAIVEAVNSAKVTSNAAAVTGNTLNMKVSGILDTGGEEEGYIFMSLDDMAILTGEGNTLSVMELSVSATSDELASYAEAVNALEGNVSARLVKRITNSETAVLAKLQALVFLVTVIVLALTMICVSTTMMAVVTERRKEIGLRKALGASDNSIRMEFLGEGMFLGMLGGALGAVLGFGFAQLVSVNVFESSIYFQPLLLPVTIIVSMAVAALSCLMPIKSAVAVDPALVLKGE